MHPAKPQDPPLHPLLQAHLATGQVGRALVGDAARHACQPALARPVGLLHAGVAVGVHPGNDEGQLGGLVEDDDVIVQRQVAVGQAAVVGRRGAERQLACSCQGGRRWVTLSGGSRDAPTQSQIAASLSAGQ